MLCLDWGGGGSSSSWGPSLPSRFDLPDPMVTIPYTSLLSLSSTHTLSVLFLWTTLTYICSPRAGSCGRWSKKFQGPPHPHLCHSLTTLRSLTSHPEKQAIPMRCVLLGKQVVREPDRRSLEVTPTTSLSPTFPSTMDQTFHLKWTTLTIRETNGLKCASEGFSDRLFPK